MVEWWELLLLGLVHLLQSWHHGGCGMGIELWVHPWYPQAILPLLSLQGCTGVGHLGLSSGTPVSSLGWCGHGELLCQVPPLDQPGVSTLTVHLQQASPSQDDTWWWHHSSVVWAASVEVELGYQQGSSGWFAPGVCGHSLWWRHGQRHKCEIIQLWRCKLTSHILCWHIIAL